MTRAPLTPEQVATINHYQNSGQFHPLTCGGNRNDENHKGRQGVLVANESGLMCPYCDYKQAWVPEVILGHSWGGG